MWFSALYQMQGVHVKLNSDKCVIDYGATKAWFLLSSCGSQLSLVVKIHLYFCAPADPVEGLLTGDEDRARESAPCMQLPHTELFGFRSHASPATQCAN